MQSGLINKISTMKTILSSSSLFFEFLHFRKSLIAFFSDIQFGQILMHLGLPRWQLFYTDLDLDLSSKQVNSRKSRGLLSFDSLLQITGCVPLSII